MSNAELIERLRHRKTANACSDLKEEAANALELADKRIDELKQLVEDERENAREWKLSSSAATDKLADAERKLAAAREALKIIRGYGGHPTIVCDTADEALAQIGGEDARS